MSKFTQTTQTILSILFLHRGQIIATLFFGLIASWLFFPEHQQRPTVESRKPLLANPTKTQASFSKNYGKLPLHFEANQGQVDSGVKFLARGKGYTLFLTAEGAVLAVRKPKVGDPQTGREQGATTRFRMRFVGANPEPKISGMEELPGKSNSPKTAGALMASWKVPGVVGKLLDASRMAGRSS